MPGKKKSETNDEYLERVRSYRKDNPEQTQKSQRKYYSKNREKILQEKQEYFILKSEELKEKRRVYYEENREEVIAKQKQYANSPIGKVKNKKAYYNRLNILNKDGTKFSFSDFEALWIEKNATCESCGYQFTYGMFDK